MPRAVYPVGRVNVGVAVVAVVVDDVLNAGHTQEGTLWTQSKSTEPEEPGVTDDMLAVKVVHVAPRAGFGAGAGIAGNVCVKSVVVA